MHRVKVKICGLQEEEHVVAAAEAGADYVGLVFAPSRRQVTPETAERLRLVLDGLRTRPAVVGVFVDESPQQVNAIAGLCRLDAVQLCGDESGDYFAMMEIPVIKAIRVFPATTMQDITNRIDALMGAATLQPVTFLLDTGSHAARGGTGQTFDWRIAREVSASRPVMVAGGLDASSVGRLVCAIRPYGVDVSSGVERGGRKDSLLIHAFVDSVRKAEQEIDHAEDITA
jgi:phosphoribosylanthranilate isomerase